jgi:hypothetical protein
MRKHRSQSLGPEPLAERRHSCRVFVHCFAIRPSKPKWQISEVHYMSVIARSPVIGGCVRVCIHECDWDAVKQAQRNIPPK